MDSELIFFVSTPQSKMSSKIAANFLWTKGGPKPVSTKTLNQSSWLLTSSLNTPNRLEVNFKAGSREFGLSSEYAEGKLSEVALKRKYS